MNKNDIKNYVAFEQLGSGQHVVIRAVRPEDKGRMVETLRAVSPDSFYLRAFSPKRELNDNDLKQLTDVDFETVVALVAAIGEGPQESIVGGGRYVRLGPDSSAAEVAFLIDDAHQGLGIGSRIFQHLVVIAKASGIDRFDAEVLTSNLRMLRLFDRCGFPTAKVMTLDSMHITIDLQTEMPALDKQMKAA